MVVFVAVGLWGGTANRRAQFGAVLGRCGQPEPLIVLHGSATTAVDAQVPRHGLRGPYLFFTLQWFAARRRTELEHRQSIGKGQRRRPDRRILRAAAATLTACADRSIDLI